MKEKLQSRKFWICAAAFLGSISTGIAGVASGNEVIAGIGIGCGIFSAAIYSACEAAVDKARINADISYTTVSTTSTQNIEAKSDDVMTVAAVLVPATTEEVPAPEPEQPVMEDE